MIKTSNKLAFGVQAMQSGQKTAVVNAEPQLIVSSTSGKFTISAPVSKALDVAVGENVMFFNNIKAVEDAIYAKSDDIVAIAEENGIDINSAEGQAALLEGLTVFYIAKGTLKYKSNGEPIMATVRTSKEEKQNYIDTHKEELVEALRDVLVERVGNADATDDELAAAIAVTDIEAPTYHAAEGSKTASTGNATGVGCQLSFTDTAIWNLIKKDLGDNATKKNRVFKVLTDTPITTAVNNGFQNVDVKMFPLEFVEDKDPIVREVKKNEEVA